MDKRRFWIYTIGAIIGVVLVAAVLAYFFRPSLLGLGQQTTTPFYTNDNTPISVLSRVNPDFVTASNYANQGDYADALAYYQKALAAAQDIVQEAQIKFNIGLMQEDAGSFSDAVQTFKAVADNTQYYPVIRAYSVEEMGLMYYANEGNNAAIAAEIFSGDPYASFAQGFDLSTPLGAADAYRNLFEYAVSIYPLSLSESYIALTALSDLSGGQKGATTTPVGAQDVTQAVKALSDVQIDFSRLSSNPAEGSYVPQVFAREAQVTASLALYGVPGYTNDAAETLYKNTLQSAVVNGYKPGNFFVYHYAVFLAQTYGASRAADLKNLLSVFSTGDAQGIVSQAPIFFAAALTSPSLVKEKPNLALLGRLDPDFKSYLISLGWHASDF